MFGCTIVCVCFTRDSSQNKIRNDLKEEKHTHTHRKVSIAIQKWTYMIYLKIIFMYRSDIRRCFVVVAVTMAHNSKSKSFIRFSFVLFWNEFQVQHSYHSLLEWVHMWHTTSNAKINELTRVKRFSSFLFFYISNDLISENWQNKQISICYSVIVESIANVHCSFFRALCTRNVQSNSNTFYICN